MGRRRLIVRLKARFQNNGATEGAMDIVTHYRTQQWRRRKMKLIRQNEPKKVSHRQIVLFLFFPKSHWIYLQQKIVACGKVGSNFKETTKAATQKDTSHQTWAARRLFGKLTPTNVCSHKQQQQHWSRTDRRPPPATYTTLLWLPLGSSLFCAEIYANCFQDLFWSA